MALVFACPADAQKPASDTSAAVAAPILVGSPQEDLGRITGIVSATSAASGLIRAASHGAIAPTLPRRLVWNWMKPSAQLTWNSAIPFSLNDGSQWAGRGLTGAVSGGIHARLGRAAVVLAPQLWWAQNARFPVPPGGDPGRNDFASPSHFGLASADLPVRFGSAPTLALDAGESAVWFAMERVVVGVANESQWWGPGIRNALVLSNNAGGFPHAFLRTASPLATRFGEFEAKWIAGQLTESRYFDSDSSNDARSLSGVVVTFRPAMLPTATAGVARVAYTSVRGTSGVAERAFDAFTRWGKPDSLDSRARPTEQLMSVFGRLIFPKSSAETYVEWARILSPRSFREFLIAPQFTQGFTIGLQWLPEIAARTRLRIQAEVTNLEQSPASQAADSLMYYTSSAVPQGYTQRGQVLGAAIGPGSSSQWLGVDLLRGDNAVGLFLGRIRWDTDAYYLQQPPPRTSFGYDVSVFGGLRLSRRVSDHAVATELALQRRMNFLFQNGLYGFANDGAFDKTNLTVRLGFY